MKNTNKLPVFVTIPVLPNDLHQDESHDKDFLVADIKSYMDNNIMFKDKTEVRTTLNRLEIAMRVQNAYIDFYKKLK